VRLADNVPVALQVVGLPFSENTLLAVGREFQARPIGTSAVRQGL
jgi:Asp-tRNA(Asn)/Glu-tRNA(Gln) amidotransferase A subunit family amidase